MGKMDDPPKCVCVWGGGGGGVEREKEGKNQWELQSGTISGLAEEEPDCQNEAGSLLNGEWESTRRKLGWRGGGGVLCQWMPKRPDRFGTAG